MLVSALQTRLDNLADETVTAAKSLAWINDAYRDVTGRYDWSWLQANGSFNTVIGDHDYTLATDKDRIITMRTKSNKLQAKNIQWLTENHPQYPEYTGATATTGTPQYYVEYENEVNLFPIPNEVETVYYNYKKSITDLIATSTPLIPEKYQEVLVYGAYLRWLLADEADQNMIDNGKREYESMIQRMMQDEQQTQQASQPIPWGRREIK